MMKKLLKILALVLMVTMLLSACGASQNPSDTASSDSGSSAEPPAASADVKVLQLGHVNPGKEEDHLQTMAVKFNEYLGELSGGTIRVSIASDSQLGTDREVVEGMQMGTVDLSISINSTLGAFMSEMQVFDLPYLFTTREEVYSVFDDREFMNDLETQLYDTVGIKVLAWGDGGFRGVMNNVRPIATVEDLKGIKLRLPESAVWAATFQALGANPTTMAYSETFPAVQQKTIDGLELPIPSTYTSGYYEVCQYYSFTDHLFTPLPLIISKITWESMTEEEQGWIQEAADKAVADERAYIVTIEEKWTAEMAEKGMEFNTVEDKTPFVETAQSVYSNFESEIGAESIQRTLEKLGRQ